MCKKIESREEFNRINDIKETKKELSDEEKEF